MVVIDDDESFVGDIAVGFSVVNAIIVVIAFVVNAVIIVGADDDVV